MALTRGDRKNRATVSSIQSRMGVVSAYEGSGIADAAKSISGVLNIEAERRAANEEEKWKTDFRIKTRETLKEKARENFDNPSEFTNYTNSYIKGLKEDAPVRFKSYAEEFASQIAFTHGEKIFQVRQDKDKLIQGDNIVKDASDMLYDAIELLNGTPSTGHQDIYATNIIPHLSEIMKTYEVFYNSLTGVEQAALPTGNPEQYNKALMVSIETERLKVVAKERFLKAAQTDDEFLAKGLLRDDDGLTEVEALMLELQKEQQDYIVNPNYNEEEGLEVFMDTDVGDREKITETVGTYVQQLLTNNKKTQDKVKQVIELDKESRITFAQDAIDNYNFIISDQDELGNQRLIVSFNTLEEVTAYGNSINANTEQIGKLQNSWILSNSIRKLSENQITSFDPIDGVQFATSRTEFDNKVRGFQFEISSLGYKGDALTSAEIKQKVVDYNLFLLMEEYIPSTQGYKNFANLNLTAAIVGPDGEIVKNNLTTMLVNFSKNMGYIPTQLDDMFTDVLNMQIGDNDSGPFTKQDLDTLQATADMANIISQNTSLNKSAFSAEALTLLPLLVDLNANFEKNIVSRTSGMTTDEIKKTKEKFAEMDLLIVKEFLASANPDATRYDEVLGQLNKVQEENEQGYTIFKFSEEKLEDVQENDLTNMFGVFDQGIITGVKAFNLFSLDRVTDAARAGKLEPEFDLAMEEFQPIMERLLVQKFYNSSLTNINGVTLNKAMEELFPTALFLLQKQNYGYEERGLYSLFGN
tara:strand:+ start:461 stop:2725 length:2265 start_codon:yes stop_codon:yes gene_type:complete